MITRARTLSINCRNRTAMADIPFPSRHWTRRLPVLIKFINNCAPSVIGVQETRDDMAVDITNGLVVIQHVEGRPDHERVIIFGDFNSTPTNASVRKIASDAGYRHLRAKLSTITRKTCNSFNGWKITKRESKWIDDVLTSRTVKPYAAAIMFTDSTTFPIFASDHNGVFAKIEFSSPPGLPPS